jgi:hypothetical protein
MDVGRDDAEEEGGKRDDGPLQNLSKSTSDVSQPIDFRMPISLRSSAERPVALSQAKMMNDSTAAIIMTSIMPPRQSKMES